VIVSGRLRSSPKMVSSAGKLFRPEHIEEITSRSREELAADSRRPCDKRFRRGHFGRIQWVYPRRVALSKSPSGPTGPPVACPAEVPINHHRAVCDAKITTHRPLVELARLPLAANWSGLPTIPFGPTAPWLV
jgi:hypothetical protein